MTVDDIIETLESGDHPHEIATDLKPFRNLSPDPIQAAEQALLLQQCRMIPPQGTLS